MPPLHTKKIMQLLETKKSCNLSGRKKITQPLGTKKIMQPLRKKITQSLKTKQKIMQPLGTKNHSTSRDKQKYTTSQKKKKSHNHSGQKNNPNRSKQLQQNQIWSNIVQYAKKKNINIMNSIGWPLNPGSPGSSILIV